MIAASPSDYRALARRRLPRFLFEYIDGGSYAERTLRRNEVELGDLALRQRVLTSVGEPDMSTRLFGAPASLPLALAPIGLAGLNARRGEVQAARAAEAAGVPFCLSTVGACALDEVVSGTTRPFWFQLYMIRDRAFMADLLDQAAAAGCSTLVFTVDMPVPGTRYRDYRTGLAGASGISGRLRRVAQVLARPGWAWDVGVRGRPHSLGNVAPVLAGRTGIEDFFAWMRNNFDPTIGWRDIDFIRSRWRGPLIVKGVLDPEDAREAAQIGADGLVVSNHGGRQLDGVRSAASALPRIAQAVGDRMTVLADGGVRSGLDIVRMLSLGAKGVLIGRLWAYALAAGGQRGVERMLALLAAEMRVAMTLTGCSRVDDIGPHCLDAVTQD